MRAEVVPETDRLLDLERGAHASPTAYARLVRWSIGDWVSTLIVFGIGYWADKTWLPFQRDIVPQLKDPTISYPHTPSLDAQVPGPLLWRLALHLPLLLILLMCKLWPHPTVSSTHEKLQYLSEALLGLLSAVAAALLAVSFVKVCTSNATV